MKYEKDLLKRIVVDPNILVGKPIINGTRISVELVLKKLAQGIDVKGILEDFPRLTERDIKAVILYAESLVEEEPEAKQRYLKKLERIRKGKFTRVDNFASRFFRKASET